MLATMYAMAFVALALFLALRFRFRRLVDRWLGLPVSVNYHISRECNYSCSFCFHTNTNAFHLELPDAKRGLKLLADAGMRKLNFAGGEVRPPMFSSLSELTNETSQPLLLEYEVGELARYCKDVLKLESVSIVTNGSALKERWLVEYGKHIDIIAVSVDSFNETVNRKIGRGNGRHIKGVRKAAALCRKHGIMFKLNTVVAAFNVDEDMTREIIELKPKRWKVFQVLAVEGENAGAKALRNVEDHSITAEQFNAFLKRHASVKVMVPESNEQMRSSYLLLDERMRFLDCSNGGKTPGKSILAAGVTVQSALQQSGWDSNMFNTRGGVYDWKKAECSQDIEDC